jgi:hypothetical protein
MPTSADLTLAVPSHPHSNGSLDHMQWHLSLQTVFKHVMNTHAIGVKATEYYYNTSRYNLPYAPGELQMESETEGCLYPSGGAI